jgi:hypothetical protein
MTERWIGAIRVGSTVGNFTEKRSAMRSAIGGTMVTFLGGLFVIVVLFLATTKIMHIWAALWDGHARRSLIALQLDLKRIVFE